MKYILLFLLIIISLSDGISQDDILPMDESGKYTFYEVVDAKDFDSLTLLNNAEYFLKNYINKNQKKTLHRDDSSYYVSANSSFLVYKKGSMGKNADGAIEYSLKIEVKDQKYRYFLTDFYLQEYERNRYGKFEPIKGKVIPLETIPSKLNEWQWNDHKKTVKNKMSELISALKVDMLRLPEAKKKKKDKDNW